MKILHKLKIIQLWLLAMFISLPAYSFTNAVVIGSSPNNEDGDPLKTSFEKLNFNIAALIAAGGPTNGITAATATNIAAFQAFLATNNLVIGGGSASNAIANSHGKGTNTAFFGDTTITNAGSTASGYLAQWAANNLYIANNLFFDGLVFRRNDASLGDMLIQGRSSGNIEFYSEPSGLGITNPLVSMVLAGQQYLLLNSASQNQPRGFAQANYTSSGGGGNILLEAALGTQLVPLALTSGKSLGAISFNGYDGSNFANDHQAIIQTWAAGNFTTTSKPTFMTFQQTPTGTNVVFSQYFSADGTIIATNSASGKFSYISPTNVVSDSLIGALVGTNITGVLITSPPTNQIVGWIQIGLKFGTTNLFIPCVFTNQ